MDELIIGATCCDGRYQAVEHLHGTGNQRMFVGVDRSGHACLMTVGFSETAAVHKLRDELDTPAINGVLPFAFVGRFDRTGDEALDLQRRAHPVLVEQLPAGVWLPRVAPDAGAAARVGLSVGAILQRAAAAGQLLTAVRPEWIWLSPRGKACGLTDRPQLFLYRATVRCAPSVPLFERLYCAPEVYRNEQATEQSLVFTLSTMVAEWLTGAYPFPDSYTAGRMTSLCLGRHAPLPATRLGKLLSAGLDKEPDRRPTLAKLLAKLKRAT